jgi:hypothetical protein
MATVLDVSLLSFLSPLFVFLLVFVLIYAILSKTSMFGEKQNALNFVAAICIAALSLFMGTVTKLISVVTPWIFFIIFVLVLLFAMFQFFGMENKEIWASIGGPILIYVIILLVIIIGLALVFGNQATDPDKTVKSETVTALTHPRLLGALFILLITAFAVRLLSDKIEA